MSTLLYSLLTTHCSLSMNDWWMIYGMAFGSVGCIAAAAYPLLSRWWLAMADRMDRYQQARVSKVSRELDDIFMFDVKPLWLKLTYGFGPLIAGVLIFVMCDNLVFAGIGMVLAVIIPDLWVRRMKAIRKNKFQGQIVDALFMLASSLRAGLSMTQAFESLESELPAPASQEFGLVIKAHKIGLPFDDALQALNRRMACEELNLIVTALLMAKGTGGDVTKVLDQLVVTIREKRKLIEKVKTLTLQGKLQAYIMSGLPIFFAVFVRSFNPNYFDVMLTDPTGQALLITCVVLWLVGMFLLFKLSKVDV